MYSSFCILLRLRSCSAGTPAGVFAFWDPVPQARAVQSQKSRSCLWLSVPRLSAMSCWLGRLTVRYHNEQTVACDVSSLAATLTKKRGDPFVSLLLVPVVRVFDCQLSGVSSPLDSLVARHYSEQTVACDVSSLDATLTKKRGGTPLCRSCRSPRPRGLRLSAVGCDLSAWQPNRPVPQRTGRHLRRKFFSCNAYKNVGGGADRADDQAHSNKITPWQWPPRHAGTPTTLVLSIVYFITRGHQGWGVQHQKIPPAVVVTLDELQGFATGQEKPLARPRQCHSERSEESAFRK